jgi:DNA-binding FadR family transcriptional regulator
MHVMRRDSLATEIVTWMRHEIEVGSWVVGERIPTEPILCEMTGVGRNTVREAVQALVHTGLLQRRQGSGTYVTGRTEGTTTLRRYLTDSSSVDVVEFRGALCASAAYLAAERRDESEVEGLRVLLASIEGSYSSAPSEARAAVAGLWRLIITASRNTVILQFCEVLLRGYSTNLVGPVGAAVAGFSELIEAIAEKSTWRAFEVTLSLTNNKYDSQLD